MSIFASLGLNFRELPKRSKCSRLEVEAGEKSCCYTLNCGNLVSLKTLGKSTHLLKNTLIVISVCRFTLSGVYSLGLTIALNIASQAIVYSIRVTATWDFVPYYLTILEESGL